MSVLGTVKGPAPTRLRAFIEPGTGRWIAIECDPLNPRGFVVAQQVNLGFAPLETPFENIEHANIRFEELAVDKFGFELIEGILTRGVWHLTHKEYGTIPPIDQALMSNLQDASFASW